MCNCGKKRNPNAKRQQPGMPVGRVYRPVMQLTPAPPSEPIAANAIPTNDPINKEQYTFVAKKKVSKREYAAEEYQKWLMSVNGMPTQSLSV